MKHVLTSFLKKWEIKGELILNCNCTVFCPCVVSLGKHPPTETFCQAWTGIRIDEGYYDKYDLSGINVAMMLEIPGRMARWVSNRCCRLVVAGRLGQGWVHGTRKHAILI